jgi:hypothetical protein
VLTAIGFVAVRTPPGHAQEAVTLQRPIPGPVVPPPYFRRALEQGTRSADGGPGPRYWQQHATYEIDARLDPAKGLLNGRQRIIYENRSPQELQALTLHLYQNLHAPGTVRARPQELTGGVRLARLAFGDEELALGDLSQGPGYAYLGTGDRPSQVLMIRPPGPVPSGDSVEIEIDWEFTLPQNSSGRMGHSDHEVYFVAYWFPRLAVYDDLRGWDTAPYLGGAEFYDGFGDYRVAITVPAGWTVMATGILENPEEVLSAQTRERLAAALQADTIVKIVTRDDRDAAEATISPTGETLTYRFSAQRVRDFTWTASDAQLWYGTSARVPDRNGDGRDERVAIHSLFREYRAPLWEQQALYAKHAIEHHSRFTGFAYPWPHMTSVEGGDIIGGGMEFPMLTVIGPYEGRQPVDLYSVTAHELAHMWIPMIVGTDERRHAWMDEGSTSFLENQGRPEYWPGINADSLDSENYLNVARAELEGSMMTHGDYYAPGPGYGTASYAKPATLLVTLRGLLGDDRFTEAYQTFVTEWAFRHPTPWDFFNTFERVSGMDLDWFWSSWYYETWTLDQAVADVRLTDGRTTITVEDRGFAPMPVLLRVTNDRGEVVERRVSVDAWLRGETRVEVTVAGSFGEVVEVEIDPWRRFPDTDRKNNVWRKD